MERLEPMLDIRSLFKVHTNLAVLITTLLTEQQQILFKF